MQGSVESSEVACAASKPGVVGSSPAGRARFPLSAEGGESRNRKDSKASSPRSVPANDAANKPNARPALSARAGSPCVEASGPLSNGGYVKRGSRLAHRVAYAKARGPIPAGMMVLHSCDNRRCINVDHLRLGTHAENMRDRLERGRTAKGERHGSAKLTDAQAAEILRSPLPVRFLAADYGVSRTTIRDIKKGRRRGPSRPATPEEAAAARKGMRALRARRAALRTLEAA